MHTKKNLGQRLIIFAFFFFYRYWKVMLCNGHEIAFFIFILDIKIINGQEKKEKEIIIARTDLLICRNYYHA